MSTSTAKAKPPSAPPEANGYDDHKITWPKMSIRVRGCAKPASRSRVSTSHIAKPTAIATSGYHPSGPITSAATTSAPRTNPVMIASLRSRPALFFGFGALNFRDNPPLRGV